MKIQRKSIKQNLLGILAAGAIALGANSARAQTPVTNLEMTVTNDCSIEWVWGTNYQVNARSSDETRGYVGGDTNNWIEDGSNATVSASAANEDYIFSGWTGDTNASESTLNILVDKPYTNLVAKFSDNKTNGGVVTNGVPFRWFTQYGLTNKTASGELEDSDGDGMKNWQEYIAGTDPTNSASYFWFAEFVWESAPGHNETGTYYTTEQDFIDYGIPTNTQIPFTNYVMDHASSRLLVVPDSLTNRDYGVDSSSDLVSGIWNKETNSSGNGGTLIFDMIDDTEKAKFYKVNVKE